MLNRRTHHGKWPSDTEEHRRVRRDVFTRGSGERIVKRQVKQNLAKTAAKRLTQSR